MKERIIELCKEVIAKDGDLRKTSCRGVQCIDDKCPFVDSDYYCREETNEEYLKIAKDYIAKSETDKSGIIEPKQDKIEVTKHMKLVETCVIHSFDHDHFVKEMTKTINSLEKKGYKVEIRYTPLVDNGKLYFHALLLSYGSGT